MKILKLKPLNLLYNFVIVALVAGAVFGFTPEVLAASVVTATATGIALGFIPRESAALMAVQREIWENHVEEEIFKDNTFLRFSYNADAFIINNKAVHIPQSGGSGNVVKNRTSLPATVRKRNDTDVIYLIDEYTTDPVLIPHADTKELSYDKRNSVLSEDRDKLNQTIAEETLYNWTHSPVYGTYGATVLPSTFILETSGADVPASAPDATGNRKAMTLTDLQKMQTFLRKQNRWIEGRMNALLPPDMLVQCFPADSVITATYMQSVTEEERRNGIMFKAQGWNIMNRSSVMVVDGAGEIKAPGEVGAADDDEAALFWYQDAVELAYGGVEMFDNPRDPQYYGDLYSFLVRMGSRARRVGYEGIALLKQAKGTP